MVKNKDPNINENTLTIASLCVLFSFLITLNSNGHIVYAFLLLLFLVIAVTGVAYSLLLKYKYSKQQEETTAAILKRDNIIKDLSYVDELTGINNKRKLLKDGSEFINKNSSIKLAIICIDIKDFQNFNELRGIVQGDNILRIIASVLTKCGEGIKHFSVGKIGSDEYGIILEGDKDNAIKYYEKFNLLFNEELKENDISDEVSFTLGSAVYPQHAQNINALYEKARATLKISRENNSRNIAFFDEKVVQLMVKKRILEQKLRRAITNSNFVLYYQPKVDLKTGNIIGREALIRWIDAIEGMIPPDTFIPVAEKNGLIKDIDDWVIKNACYQNTFWHSKNIGEKVQISINISSQEFYQSNIVEKIKSALIETGLEPQYLDIEVTETMMMMNIDDAISTMKELKKLGVTISLDDFGTGYSSLAYLRELPIDVLKIDKSFIDELEVSQKGIDITKYIIGLAKSLGIKVVAEGIETKKQNDILIELGCDVGQGYYYGRPVSADIVEFEGYKKDFKTRGI